MKEGLARVASELGPPGASDRAARAVLEVLEAAQGREGSGEAGARAASR